MTKKTKIDREDLNNLEVLATLLDSQADHADAFGDDAKVSDMVKQSYETVGIDGEIRAADFLRAVAQWIRDFVWSFRN